MFSVNILCNLSQILCSQNSIKSALNFKLLNRGLHMTTYGSKLAPICALQTSCKDLRHSKQIHRASLSGSAHAKCRGLNIILKLLNNKITTSHSHFLCQTQLVVWDQSHRKLYICRRSHFEQESLQCVHPSQEVRAWSCALCLWTVYSLWQAPTELPAYFHQLLSGSMPQATDCCQAAPFYRKSKKSERWKSTYRDSGMVAGYRLGGDMICKEYQVGQGHLSCTLDRIASSAKETWIRTLSCTTDFLGN